MFSNVAMKCGKIKSTPNSASNVTGGRGVQAQFSKENCLMTDLYSDPGFSSTLINSVSSTEPYFLEVHQLCSCSLWSEGLASAISTAA
jgi:hypothetical protein